MGIIEFKDVSFQYPNGFSAVENVSFEINEGEAIAIIGQNGAGKTTTVKMINGLLKPTHGTVLIDGMDTKDYTTAQLSKIAGYVFQNPDDQIFHNNVEDEIRFGPKKQGLSEEEIENPKERRAHIGIQSVLKRIHILYGTDYGMTMVGIVLSTLPTVIVFFTLQKSFVEGMTGSVK